MGAPDRQDHGLLQGFGFEDDSWIERLQRAEEPLDQARIGPYRIVEEVSRGGQGIVYRAMDPRNGRTVAVKLLLAGPLSTASARRRFEHEIEALRALDHPNVVSGIELEIVDGAPVLVMEWIDGAPITRWVAEDEERRDPRAIARLLIKVCDGVHHAHAHGMIHRDLKPANILIDAQGEPHVIDFGLAKRFPGDADEAGTASGRFLGTISYAPLEQLYGNGTADVRSDVFSLGVILYELLTGRLPFGEGRSAAATARAIEHDELTLPSRIAAVGRDIEAITLKALAKDGVDRYASVGALSSDLRRFLARETVEARAVRGWSELGRSLRRHPVATAAGLSFLVVLGVCSVAFAYMAHENARQRDAALDAEQDALDEAAKAKAINDFINRTLSFAQPGQAGRDATVRAALDRAANELDLGRLKRPLVEASVRSTLGRTYQLLGEYEAAGRQLRRAAALYRAEGEQDPDLGVALNNLGHFLGEQGRYEEAEALLQESLGILRASLGEEDPLVADTLNNLGAQMMRQGRVIEAAAVLRQAVQARGETDPEGRRRLAGNLSNLAVSLREQGELEESVSLYRDAVSILTAVLGLEHTDTVGVRSNLAACLSDLGKHDEAEEILVWALERFRRDLGEDHPRAAFCLDTLAGIALARGDTQAAREYAAESFELRRQAFGEEHPESAISLNNLAMVSLRSGHLDEALDTFEHALDLSLRVLPEGHWHLGNLLSGYGECLRQLGELDAAEAELLEGERILSDALGPEHERSKKAVERLVQLYQDREEPGELATWRKRLEQK